MPDERPRPQYGEYATPEQQAQAMGKRPIPPLRHFPGDPTPGDPTSTGPSSTGPSSSGPSSTEVPPPPNPDHRVVIPQRAVAHPIDRIVTMILLAFGVYSLLTNVELYLNFGSGLATLARAYGFSYPVTASATHAGYWLLGLQVVLYAATVVFALRQLRRSKIAFYIPVAGFLAFFVGVSIVFATVVPDFLQRFSDHFSTLS